MSNFMESKKIGIIEAFMTEGLFRKSLVPMPRELMKELFKLILYIGIGTIVKDVIAFTLEFSKEAVTNGYVMLSILCVALYSIRKSISDKYWIKSHNKEELYKERMKTIIHGNAVQVLLNVRGHIYKNVNGKHEQMTSNEVINTYVSTVEKIWQLITLFLRDVTQFISLIISLIGFMVVTSMEIENTILFFFIITVISIVTLYFSKKKVKAHTDFVKPFKGSCNKRDDAQNDILNIEAINDEHLDFMYKKFERASTDTYQCERKRSLETVKNGMHKSNLESLVILLIIAIKVYETGMNNIQLTTIISIVAILDIYAQIMGKITQIINMTAEYQVEIETLWIYKDDFFNIMKCNMAQLDMKAQSVGVINSLIVPAGEIKYKYQVSGTPFKVKVCNDILLNIGDVCLFTGPTGCGKSTMLKAIVGNTIFDNYVLSYNFITAGKVKALMQQADARLGCNDILSELTFGKEFDREKLLWILKGLHLYDEIAEKNSDVLWYLANSKADSFSNGQKQRLLIARYATKHFRYIPGIEENSYQVNC